MQDTTQTVLLPNLFIKPVVAAFAQPNSSSDGGAIVLRGADQSLGLTAAMSRGFVDSRQPGKVIHSKGDLLCQRVHLIACGYADCNDADRLANDPVQKLLLGRDPISGQRLASQPTLSRFENMATSRDLLMMANGLAEVTRLEDREARDNPRYVVTNMTGAPEAVYDVYRMRGEMENRIKELHHGLEMDRTSCTSFKANQLRVLMTAAAFVLMQEMRRLLTGTDCERAQVTTMRERLMKMAVWVKRSARRIVLHLPEASAWSNAWIHLARQIGAATG